MVKSLTEHLYQINKDISTEIESTVRSEQKIISQQKIKAWCEQCRSLDDVVALATTAFRHGDRASSEGFEEIAEQLSEAEIPVIQREQKGIKHITLVSAVMDGPHIKLLYSYVAVMLCIREIIAKVSLIFTGEWQWFAWQRGKHKERLAKLYEDFYQQLKRYDGGLIAYRLFRKKLKILLSPKGEEFNVSLGDLIIRFEGPYHFRSTYISTIS